MIRYFDDHLHMKTADAEGFDAFLEEVGGREGLVGGNLVLNTQSEVDVLEEHFDRLPEHILPIPPLPVDLHVPDRLLRRGWFKIHPPIHRIDRTRFPVILDEIHRRAPLGVMIHHFPWGHPLVYETSLPLILEVAEAFPSMPVLATHGGGYESWALRAHTARLPNVYYDYSLTLTYMRGTDVLAPLRQLLERRRNRMVFGSDWPSALAEEQVTEMTRIAAQAGLDEGALEALLLENSRRLWPESLGSTERA